MVLGVCRRRAARPARRRGRLPGHLPGAVRRADSLRHATCWAAGSTGSPAASRCGQGERRPTWPGRAAGAEATRRLRMPTGDVGRCSTRARPVAREVPPRSCSATWKARPTRRPRDNSAGRPGTVKGRLARPASPIARTTDPARVSPRRPGSSGRGISSESSAGVRAGLAGLTVRAAMGLVVSRSPGRGGPGLGRLPDGRSAEDHGHHQAEDDRDHLDGSHCRSPPAPRDSHSRTRGDELRRNRPRGGYSQRAESPATS